MDIRRAACDVRRTGVGRTWRRVAGVGRLVPLLERNLWPEQTRQVHLVFIHLAIDLQRAAFDCVGLHRTVAIRQLYLARPGPYIFFAGHKRAGSFDRHVQRKHCGDGRHVRCLWDDCDCSLFAISQDHHHWPPLKVPLGRCFGDRSVGDFCGRNSL